MKNKMITFGNVIVSAILAILLNILSFFQKRISFFEMVLVAIATLFVVVVLLICVVRPYVTSEKERRLKEQKKLIKRLKDLMPTMCERDCPISIMISDKKYLHQYNLVEKAFVEYYECEFGKIAPDFSPEVWILTDNLPISEFQQNTAIKTNLLHGIKYKIFYIADEMDANDESLFKQNYSDWGVTDDFVKLISIDETNSTSETLPFMKYAMASVSMCILFLAKNNDDDSELSELYGFISLSSGGRGGQREYFKMLPCTLKKYFDYLKTF